jgi:hypothetical protein
VNPNKLFDYLDGNLPPYEREQLEEQLASDPQLQRELAMARKIHRGMHGESEEVIAPPDPRELERGRKIGARVGAAFAGLVLLNVFIGIAFIIRGNQPKKSSAAQMHQQVTNLVEHAAEQALPTPTLSEEIRLTARRDEWDKVADSILIIAREAGGEAVKAPPDANGLTVLANIPTTRAAEFRRGMAPLGTVDFSSPSPTPAERAGVMGEKTNVYVRIAESNPSPTP